jgi:hypothetical protein
MVWDAPSALLRLTLKELAFRAHASREECARCSFFVLFPSMASGFDIVRSVHDKSLHVTGGLDALPNRVRQFGSSRGLERGEVNLLKPRYRLQPAQRGFAVGLPAR